ncbi:MAG: class I SAM-dependent methyltransferase [Candidatus Eremiobacteraeota bacterium]|nr:class I SAM-dependent methyltransferase [Candidatus Eremiobacteraeota bacterium]MBC5802151.1 class I SAM-dependent methyltransferase [Candidatus Eremiobacteraeota bacterium]
MAFARQALQTARCVLGNRPWSTLRVLDVGCGYGATTAALGGLCREAVGLEPSAALYAQACRAEHGRDNVRFVHADFNAWHTFEQFDLIILDNVYEHIADHDRTLAAIAERLAAGGAFYIVAPNKLWPIEVHYGLPFLSYLPLPIANAYLRITRRGTSYADAAYAPSVWSLRAEFRREPRLRPRFVLPADLTLTQAGATPLYRCGASLLRRFPALWAVSKALVIVGSHHDAPQSALG